MRCVLLLALILAPIGCARSGDGEAFLREVKALQEATTPAGAHLAEASPVERTAAGATISWTLEATGDWEGYSERVRARLAGFEKRDAADGTLRFVRTLPGDMHVVELRRVSRDSPFQVQVTFRAFAD